MAGRPLKNDGKRKITVPRSEEQRRQSRKNGERSRGPITEAGKANSAQNALVHGFTGAQLVPKAHQKVFQKRCEAFVQEAGDSALMRGLAEIAAIEMTRTEALCDSRTRTAAKKVRRIEARERSRLDKLLDEALELWNSGRRAESIERLARTHDGCRQIAEWWESSAEAVRSFHVTSDLPAEFWTRIDHIEPSVPEQDRPKIRDAVRNWRSRPNLPIDTLFQTFRAIAEYWANQSKLLITELEEDMDERVARAHADLGRDGKQRHRYVTSSQNLYRQSAKLILDERQRRERSRRQAAASSMPQEIGEQDALAPRESNSSIDRAPAAPIPAVPAPATESAPPVPVLHDGEPEVVDAADLDGLYPIDSPESLDHINELIAGLKTRFGDFATATVPPATTADARTRQEGDSEDQTADFHPGALRNEPEKSPQVAMPSEVTENNSARQDANFNLPDADAETPAGAARPTVGYTRTEFLAKLDEMAGRPEFAGVDREELVRVFLARYELQPEPDGPPDPCGPADRHGERRSARYP